MEFMRSVNDYGRGIVIVMVGFLILFAEKLGFTKLVLDDLMRYLFFGMCLLYGGFRIYRGYVKQYYNRDD